MKLRRECEHGQFDPHRFLQPGGHPESSIAYADCAGGEFLADDTLVIEKVDGEWPEWFVKALGDAWWKAAVASNKPLAGQIMLAVVENALAVREADR